MPIIHTAEHLPGSTLAVLLSGETHNEAVIDAALQSVRGQPVTFLYLGSSQTHPAPRLFELHDPYYDDQQAKHTLGLAQHLAQTAKIARRFVYRQQS